MVVKPQTVTGPSHCGLQACVYACVHSMCLCRKIHTHAHIHTYTHKHTHTHTNICTHTHTHTHTNMHTHTHTHNIHTHTHIHTMPFMRWEIKRSSYSITYLLLLATSNSYTLVDGGTTMHLYPMVQPMTGTIKMTTGGPIHTHTHTQCV